MTAWSFEAGGPWLWPAVGLTVALGWLSWRHVRHSPQPRRVAIQEALRLVAVIFLLLTLLRPELVRTLEREQQPQVVILVDETGSMATADIATDGEALGSRAAWAARLLQDDFAAPLASRFAVSVETIGENLGGHSGRGGTDLGGPLAALPTRYPGLRAAILISDGDWNVGGSPVGAATRLAIAKVPVYPVAAGSESYLPDVVLDEVKPPSYSLVNESVAIPFRVVNRLPGELRTEVTLNADGRPAATKRIALPPGGQLRDTVLWHAGALGEHELTLIVPEAAGELVRDNNAETFRIVVRQERLRVLVIDTVPRWEYRFLRNALSRDPGVDVHCLLLHPGGLPRGDGPDYIQTFPASRDRLGQYDVIFLGDVGVGRDELTSEQAELIRGVVDQLATGLVLLPGGRGRQFSLLESPLADLLPVTLDESQRRGFGSAREATLELTSLGADHLLTRLAATPEANRRLWSSLPGFQWSAPVVKSRPGAQVLAVHSSRRNEWGRLPLLVTRPFGQGNVLFMGTDSAWRWRKGVEDTYHYRFWGQVVRWMAHPRHLAQGNGMRLVFAPETPRQGDVVTLHATLTDASGFPLTDAEVVAELAGAGGQVARLGLLPVPGGWGVYTGSFPAQDAGRYEVTVSAVGRESRLSTVIEVTPDALEKVGEPANHGVLREIARITGGEFTAADEAARAIEQIRLLPESEPLQIRYALWSQWWWGTIILLLLGAYWVLRKLGGMI